MIDMNVRKDIIRKLEQDEMLIKTNFIANAIDTQKNVKPTKQKQKQRKQKNEKEKIFCSK